MELYQILEIIKKRIVLITIIIFISTSISAILSYFYITPLYKATTTVIVGKMPESNTQKVQYYDILMYQKLVKTYVEIAKSEEVAQRTAEKLHSGLTPGVIKSMLSASPAADTEVLYLTITDESPERAAATANTLAEVFMDRVTELMRAENVQIMDVAKVPKSPFSPRPMMNTAIGFFLGLMGALGLVFLLEYMDSSIKTEDDIEKALGLPVIGIIPKMQ